MWSRLNTVGCQPLLATCVFALLGPGCTSQKGAEPTDAIADTDAAVSADTADTPEALDTSDSLGSVDTVELPDAVNLADEIDLPDGEDSDGAPDVPDAPAAVDAPDSSDQNDVTDGSEECTYANMVQLDFPCSVDHRCTNETAYATYKSLNCAQAGYGDCCQGGICVDDSSGSCPPGELCRDLYGQPYLPACAPPNCASDKDCGASQYCLRARGQCAATGKVGVCVTTVHFGSEYPSYEPGPLCGCDGKVYSSFWQVLDAKASVDYKGLCCDPSKMPFSNQNPDGFTELEVCGLTPGLSFGLGCKKPPVNTDCAGTTSCTLEIPAAATISDAKWTALCGAATAGTKAYGHPAKP